MKPMKKLISVLFICMIVVLSGCSSHPSYKFNMQNRQITIVTEPAGATVTQVRPMGQQSTYLGKTPLKDQTVVVMTKLTKAKNLSYSQMESLMRQVNNVVVRIEKDGYEPYYGTLRVEDGKTVEHEIILQEKPEEAGKTK